MRDWINDLAMVLFFFVAGLEIKREVTQGELRDPKQAALPVIAAFGGMIAPAVIFAMLNAGGSGSRGWGIPMATDIAIVAGVVALLGRRVPSWLKLFLLALAIADDIGAIVVIAIFYSNGVSLPWLAAAVSARSSSPISSDPGFRSSASISRSERSVGGASTKPTSTPRSPASRSACSRR